MVRAWRGPLRSDEDSTLSTRLGVHLYVDVDDRHDRRRYRHGALSRLTLRSLVDALSPVQPRDRFPTSPRHPAALLSPPRSAGAARAREGEACGMS
ncbi:hypothetical protein SCOCK_20235 [Actinacidiphila cocklensis]|uniref:Uncharacterized protein n=1 Tax=Actinacidiphila cocklensis TaxID=887465 RepID=A0A9W4DSL2_9ACTN|nr:hypothetical protein SCOCK_20235 [Actinacidiphila cocklensis]